MDAVSIDPSLLSGANKRQGDAAVAESLDRFGDARG